MTIPNGAARLLKLEQDLTEIEQGVLKLAHILAEHSAADDRVEDGRLAAYDAHVSKDTVLVDQLDALETDTNKLAVQVMKLAEHDLALIARLDKLDRLMVHLHRDHHEGVVARLEALDHALQEAEVVQDGHRLALDALGQAAKDQARNSNASAIAFNGRLDRQGAAIQLLKEEVAALEKPVARPAWERDALA